MFLDKPGEMLVQSSAHARLCIGDLLYIDMVRSDDRESFAIQSKSSWDANFSYLSKIDYACDPFGNEIAWAWTTS